MNKVKSLFIGIYPMLAMSIGGYALYQYLGGKQEPAWLGAVLTTLPLMAFLMSLLAFKYRARTSAHFPIFTSLAITGLSLSSVVFFLNPSADNIVPMGMTVTGFSTYLLYNFWYSRLGRGKNITLKQGKLLPAFNLENASGERISSTGFKGKPAIFMFYRGNWCPLCMAQVREIAQQYRELESMGVQVALISPQPHEKTEALARKFDVPFEFLVDVKANAAKQLGIFMQDGLPAGMEMFGYDSDTVYPTVIITDANGKILYVDQTDNYRVRPEPSTFLAVLNSRSPAISAAY